MISKEALLEYCRSKNVSPSDKQLRSWAEIGLIPTPEIKFLGQAKGADVKYPDGTEKLVVAIDRIPRKNRNVEYVPWKLLEYGYIVPNLRPKLAEALKIYADFVDGLISGERGKTLNDNVNRYLDETMNIKYDPSTDSLKLPKNWDLISKKVMKEASYSYLLQLVYCESDFSDDDGSPGSYEYELFVKSLASVIPPQLLDIEDVYDFLAEMRDYTNPENVAEVLADANNETLVMAYLELRVISKACSGFYNIVGWFREGRKHKYLDDLIGELDDLGKSWVLLVWLSFRKHPVIQENLRILENRLKGESL